MEKTEGIVYVTYTSKVSLLCIIIIDHRVFVYCHVQHPVYSGVDCTLGIFVYITYTVAPPSSYINKNDLKRRDGFIMIR